MSESAKPKLLIVGGAGYIGSRLCADLSDQYRINSWDFCRYSSASVPNVYADYSQIEPDDLCEYDSVILLAGHSSVRMCDGNPAGVMHNNVTNFVRLLDMIGSDQTFIYASSASVYGNCKYDEASEDTPFDSAYNLYDMTKQAIDSYVMASRKIQSRVYGLRFGTVNGYSPVLRNDVMLNAMTTAAWNEGRVNLYSANTRRSILAISDLVSAVSSILKSNRSSGGIYNLASFTSTSGQMASAVSETFDVPVNKIFPDTDTAVKGNEKLTSSKYDFALNCSKFEQDFDFRFMGSIGSVLEELVAHRHSMLHTHRNSPFDYEWRCV